MDSKQQEIMIFLHDHVFNPILSSSTSNEIKQGVRLTITRLEKQKDAAGMVKYFWSSIAGKGNAISFSDKLKNAGHARFEEVLEVFRKTFTDNWLRTK